MTRRTRFWRHLALLALMASTSVLPQTSVAKGDESDQIRKRQQWLQETRGLGDRGEAGRARHQAIQMLQVQAQQMRAQQLMAGEVWEEMGPSSMQMGNWVMGRVSGRPNSIAIDPTNDSIVYFGSAAGGVWKTTNAGQSWMPIFENVGTLAIGAITIEPGDRNRIWVGTGDRNGGACAGYFGQGVFFSADGGQTWQEKNGSGSTAMPLSVVNSVAIHSTNNQTVLVGGFGQCNESGQLVGAGAYRSSNGGSTWSKVLTGKVEDIIFVPGSSVVYATVSGVGVMKSVDAGATFTQSSQGLSVGTGRVRLAMAPSNSQVLYVLAGSQLFKSTNAAASWTRVNSNACEGQCTYNQAITVHPQQSDSILVGSIRFARSTNGGTSLQTLTSSWGGNQQVHQDTHVLVYSPTNPNRFYIGSDGGIWRTDNNGSSFINMNANLNVTQFYDIAIDTSNPEKIFGGAQDNSSSSRNTSKVWNLTYASGDGFMNVVDPSNPSTILQTSYPSGGYPNIVRSFQGGTAGTFSALPKTGLSSGNFPWVTPLAAAGSKVWVASDRLYVGNTSASSFSWTAVGGALGSTVSVITPTQAGSAYPVYVGTSGGKIFFHSNAVQGAGSLTDVTNNYPGGRVSDIAVASDSARTTYVTRSAFGGAKLYRSTNNGASWSAVGNGLPNVPANAVAVDPRQPTRVFVATDIGMYQSVDSGNTFTAFNAGMPIGNVVMDLEVDDEPHVLVAGTYGRGAWKVNLQGTQSNQPPVANFQFSVSGKSVSFTDTSQDNDGQVVSRLWNFGDGTTSTQSNPAKTYASDGTYQVLLTVTDDDGASANVSRAVVISSTACAGTTINGSFAGANGQSQIQPNGSWYQSTSAGTHSVCLQGPQGTDFDVYLDRWTGSAWQQVAKSESPTSVENITYAGSSGYYRFRVVNYAGVGPYTFTYQRP